MTEGTIVVIGAGHNGLVAAALLARAGRRVEVLEAASSPGGLAGRGTFGAAGEHVHAGVLHDTTHLRPSVVRALALETHGLRFQPAAAPTVPDPDGALVVGEGREGARWAEWQAWLRRVRPLADDAFGQPALRVDSGAPFWPAARAALRLRGLGSAAMMELLRVGPTPAADWLGEWFEDPRLIAAACGPALVGSWLGPRAPTTSALVLWWELTREPREVVGGPAALVDALVAACRSAGVGIRLDARVEEIVVARGRVRAVRLQDGNEVEASVVVSGADPRRTLLDLVPPDHCPPALQQAAAGIRSRGAHAKVHLALARPPSFAGCSESAAHVVTARHPDDLERAFDAIKYGAMPERPPLDIRTGRPGEGTVLSVLVHGVPRQLRGGWNDDRREQLLSRVLAALEEVAPGIGSSVAASEVLCPATLESRFGLSGGHLYGAEHALDQLWSLRPAAALARHTTPIAGLFLCGGTHPGGGVTGGCGERAAAAVLGR